MHQKGLSGRQVRWLEKLSEFSFEVMYVPGEHNILPDALSRVYEYDEPGTIRAPAEYIQHDLMIESSPLGTLSPILTAPMLVGPEALA